MSENTPKPLTIAIAGGSGSGKTTVSNAILERVGREQIAYISHDNYYRDLSHLAPEERRKINYDHPNSLETSLLVAHLRALQAWLPVEVPDYDFSIDTRKLQTIPLLPRPIILVEGILILDDKDLRDLCDIKIFVDADADIRLIRRLQRDINARGRSFDSVIQQYLRTVRPGHLEFVEPSKRFADVIIREGGHNHVAIDMIVSRLQLLLAAQGESENHP